MGAGHYNRPTDERLLPRAKEPALQTLNMVELKRSQVQLSHENMKARSPGHSWFILALNLPADCKLWCVCICIPSNPGVSSIHSSSTMPRERGKPRRGSAWHTHAAQSTEKAAHGSSTLAGKFYPSAKSESRPSCTPCHRN
jgi:hypothetical protein